MKNNILLIAAVTIISLGIIAAVIVLSASGSEGTSSSEISSGSSQTEQTTPVQNVTEPTAEPEPIIIVVPETEETDDQTNPGGTMSLGAAEIVDLARSLVGTAFVDGGDTPDGFDNSGFIYYVLRENGYITCPRGVSAQAQMGTQLAYNQLKPGDLVFFYNESGTGAGFGGIFVGDGKMIACLMPGTTVKEVDISTDYYQNNFYHGISLS